MVDYEQPGPNDTVHLRNLRWGGALCRTRVYPAPWVTEDINLVTCGLCRRQLARQSKPVVPRAAPPAEGSTSPKRRSTTEYEGRVHVQRLTGGPLCNTASTHGVVTTIDVREVTCWSCKQAIRRYRQTEVARG